jgi:hypothetical protein
VELRAVRTEPATAPADGYTVVVLDDRLYEALRSAWTGPSSSRPRPDRPGSPPSQLSPPTG